MTITATIQPDPALNIEPFEMEFDYIDRPSTNIQSNKVHLPNGKWALIMQGGYVIPPIQVKATWNPVLGVDYQRLIDASPFALSYELDGRICVLNNTYVIDSDETEYEFAPLLSCARFGIV